MSAFQYLCYFETENADRFFANCASPQPAIGALIDAYPTYEDLVQGQNATTATIAKVCCTLKSLPMWTTPLTERRIAAPTSATNKYPNLLRRTQLQEPRQRSKCTPLSTEEKTEE